MFNQHESLVDEKQTQEEKQKFPRSMRKDRERGPPNKISSRRSCKIRNPTAGITSRIAITVYANPANPGPHRVSDPPDPRMAGPGSLRPTRKLDTWRNRESRWARDRRSPIGNLQKRCVFSETFLLFSCVSAEKSDIVVSSYESFRAE